MKNKIKLPEGWELKKLESGIYEVVKRPFELELGKDYISEDSETIVIDREGDRWNNGFHAKPFSGSKEYISKSIICSKPSYWKEATEEQVKEAFEEELIARYGEDWKNVKIKECMYFEESDCTNTSAYNCYIEKYVDNIDGWIVWNKNGCLYLNGKWAEVLDEKKVATDLSDIDRPYFIDLMGKITLSNPFYRQTKNQMTSKELCEGVLALKQLIAFRDNFHEVHGVKYRNIHGSIRFDGNEFMACKIESVEVAIFDFSEYEQAKEFYETHKDLFEELKKLY